MRDKSNGKTSTVEPQSLPKMPTRIEGLDEVLHGGVPEGRLTIVNGGPGAGKTVLGLELVVRRTEAGQSAVFISFEETREAIWRNALAMGWDLAHQVDADKLALINPEIDYKAVLSGSFQIDGLCAILEGQAKRIGAQLIVIDAVDMLMLMFNDPASARVQLISLHRWLNRLNLTAVMTVKSMESNHREYDYLDYMADCVINLNQRTQEHVTTHHLHVVKYRGSGFASREHPFLITEKGIVVMPLSFVRLIPQSSGPFLSTGHSRIDEILGGGYRKSSSILISGPSGSGKTTLAFTFSSAIAHQGKRVLYISFEQPELAHVSEMQSLGLDIEPLLNNGTLRISSVMPESMDMGEHLYRIVQKIEEYKPELIVLDAISATTRTSTVQAGKDFLIRLNHVAKKQGITCIFTNQTISSNEDELELSGLGISSLVDTAIILNYFRERDRIGRTLLVLKSRGTNHSSKYHEFRITDNGIVISDA